MLLSGLGMATADVETFAKSPAFVVKLSLVTLLVVNGIVLTRTERAIRSFADGPGGRAISRGCVRRSGVGFGGPRGSACFCGPGRWSLERCW